MKAVLMSIKPKYCELIAEGKKTVEVRKTKPKLETPFKVYIYCTKDIKLQFWTGKRYSYADDHSHNIFDKCGNGKVIGEFVCNQIDTYDDDTIHAFSHEDYSKWNDFDLYNSCVHPEDFERYANDNWLYGWHISDLVIYDKPKELSGFCTIDNEAVKQCEHRERAYNNPDYTNGNLLLGSYVCNKGEIDWCTKCKLKPITRPPQSWCYVEELRCEGG